MKRYLNFSTFIILFFLADFAWAFTITIDANGYQGYYSINGGGHVTNSQNFSLSAGTHQFMNLIGGTFSFSVDSSGNVTSLHPASATGSGSTLTLSTTSLTLNPQAYPSRHMLGGHYWVTGQQTFTVVTGVTDRVYSDVGGTIADFQIDQSGAITVLTNSTGVITSANNIKFKNINLTIDPGLFTGKYHINDTDFQGVQTVVLVPGAGFRIQNPPGGTIADIIIDPDGDVTNVGRNNLVLSDSKVIFETVPFKVYPGNYNGTYTLLGYTTPSRNENTFQLIPEAYNALYDGAGHKLTDFYLNDTGGITSSTGSVIKFQTGAVFFNNITMTIDPPLTTTEWYLYGVMDTTITGSKELALIPGNPIKLAYVGAPGFYTFTLPSCTSTAVTTTVGDFDLSCVSADNFKWHGLDPAKFNDLNSDLNIQMLLGTFSTTLVSNDISINGSSISISSDNLSPNLFSLSGEFLNGRNLIEISGTDSASVSYQSDRVVWMGTGVVEVDTGNPSTNTNVTLTVYQTIGGNDYYFSQTQMTVGGRTSFYNVPQLDADITSSVLRSHGKKISFKVTEKTKVNLHTRLVSTNQ